MTTSPTTPPEPQAGATPDLAAIQARCEGAYPSVQLNKEFPWIVNDPEGREIASFEWNTDAEFYVHARADMLALLAALATSRAETEEARAERDAAKAELVAALVKEGPLNAERWTLDELLVELQKWKAVASGKTCVSFESLCFGASSLWHQTHRENFRKVDLKPASLSKWVLDYVGCIESDFPAQVLKILTTLRAQLAQREAEVEHWKNEMNQLPALVKARTERDTALARVRELEAAMDELKRRLNALETDVYKYQNQCDPEEAIPAYITGEIERISKSASDAAARAAGKGEEGAGV